MFDRPDHAWIGTAVTLLLGAGGARLLDVVLENRRLEKREFRETLGQRISKLEDDVANCHEKSAELRERVGRVEAELRAAVDDRTEAETELERLRQQNARLEVRLLEVDPECNPDIEG